jgi:hypothetical protein
MYPLQLGQPFMKDARDTRLLPAPPEENAANVCVDSNRWVIQISDIQEEKERNPDLLGLSATTSIHPMIRHARQRNIPWSFR